jgi:hypothetical protein
VQHRREAIMGAAADWIVQSATLGAQDAFERVPAELTEVAQRADLTAEARAELLDRVHERRARVRPVERGVDARPGTTVLHVEGEHVDRSGAIDRRFEGAGENDRHHARRVASTRDVAPRVGRNERLDRRRRPRLTRIGLRRASVQLRERHGPAVHMDERVYERRQAEPEPSPLDGHPERDHDDARGGHGP